MSNNTALAKQGGAITVAENKKQIVSIVQSETFKRQLAAALMDRIPADYVVRTALAMVNSSEKIQKCTAVSIAGSILALSQAGLAAEPWKGQGYLVPRNNVCTALIGYRGYVTLAYRSPKVAKAGAYVVYAGDIFDIDLGGGVMPEHKPWTRPVQDRPTRGEIIGAWAYVKLKDGECLLEWMTREDIDAVRGRSAAKDYGPWVTDYAEMARKTPFRRLFKWVPDDELQKIAAMDEMMDLGKTQTTFDAETGEIVTMAVEDEPQEETHREAVTQPQRLSDKAAPVTQQPKQSSQPSTPTAAAPQNGVEEFSGIIDTTKEGKEGSLWLKFQDRDVCVMSADVDSNMKAGWFIRCRLAKKDGQKFYWFRGLMELSEVLDGAEDAEPPAQSAEGEVHGLAGLFEEGTIQRASDLPSDSGKKPGSIGLARAKRIYALCSQNKRTNNGLDEEGIKKILAILPEPVEHLRDLKVEHHDIFEDFATGKRDWKEFLAEGERLQRK